MVCPFVWPRQAGRRHGAGPQFADYLLPRVGVRAGVVDIETIESEPARFQFGIVATVAIPFDCCGSTRRGRFRRRCQGRSDSDTGDQNRIAELLNESLLQTLLTVSRRMLMGSLVYRTCAYTNTSDLSDLI